MPVTRKRNVKRPMAMPITLPIPPSSAIPPIRQVVAAESRSESNPSGVALPSTNRQQRPAQASQRARTGKRGYHRPKHRHASGPGLVPPPADCVDLAAPAGVPKKEADDDEHDDHADADRRENAEKTLSEYVDVGSCSIGMVMVFSCATTIASPRRPISVPIVKTSELIPRTPIRRPWTRRPPRRTARPPASRETRRY